KEQLCCAHRVVADGDCIGSGVEQFLPVWNRRWFVLESHALKWYRAESSVKESGVIPLASVSEVRVFERGKDGATSLVVHSSCRPLLLRAENAGKADSWVRAIQQQVQLISSQQVKAECVLLLLLLLLANALHGSAHKQQYA